MLKKFKHWENNFKAYSYYMFDLGLRVIHVSQSTNIFSFFILISMRYVQSIYVSRFKTFRRIQVSFVVVRIFERKLI